METLLTFCVVLLKGSNLISYQNPAALDGKHAFFKISAGIFTVSVYEFNCSGRRKEEKEVNDK
jgi:hypothetical protein